MKVINLLKRVIRKIFSYLPLQFNPIARSSGEIKISRYVKTIKDFGMRIELDPYEYLDKCYLFNKYDKKSLDFLINESLQCEFFLDVGANLGFYGFALASSNKNLTSVLVEADQYSIAKIKRNIEINQSLKSRIKYINCAASINNNDVKLMINTVGNRGGSSVCIDQREWTKKKENTTITVKGMTLLGILKTFAPDRNFKWICKLDIEGYEYPVINKFLLEAKKELRPEAFIVEWTGRGIKGDSGMTTIDLLVDNGYRLVGKDNVNYFLKKL